MRKDINLWDQLRTIDFLGVMLLTSANVLLVMAFLFGGNTHPWSHPMILGALGGAMMAFILFVLHQAYGTRHPMVKHTLATNRNVLIGCTGIFLACFSNSSLYYLQPQFLMVCAKDCFWDATCSNRYFILHQGVLGFTTSKAGLWIMVTILALPLGSIAAGQYIRNTGYFKTCLITMSAVSAIGIGCSTLWIAGRLPFHIGIALFLLLGFATGCFFVALAMTIASDVPKSGMSINCKYIDMRRNLNTYHDYRCVVSYAHAGALSFYRNNDGACCSCCHCPE